MNAKNQELLKKIAIAMVDNPRSTIKELAESAGVSNATLHRFCGTREQLEKMMIDEGTRAIKSLISITEKDNVDYLEHLKELINKHFIENEILQVMFLLKDDCTEGKYMPYLQAMDAFFLKGQKKGLLRMDLSSNFLTTMFTTSIYGVISAERHGRIATMDTRKSFEHFFVSAVLA